MNSKPLPLAKGDASPSPLALWVEFHERQLSLSIKGRFRGNSLHLLCELVGQSSGYPSQMLVYQHFEKAVGYTELNTLIPPGYPRIRHIWLYGRVKGAKKPAWTVPIHLSPVQRRGHDSKPFGALPEASPCEFSSPTSSSPSSASIVTIAQLPPDQELQSGDLANNLCVLAEQGNLQAIAYSLHESLINLGINAAIGVKRDQPRPHGRKDRLWIVCRAEYSPAAALVGEPIARQLRALSLHNVEDAILQFQVNGEDTPDWVLRIDLTPQEEMLKDWARWGDVEAISRLLNQALQPLDSQLVEASLQGITLHLHCAALTPKDRAEKCGDQCVEESLSKPSIVSQRLSDISMTSTATLLDVQRIRAKIDYILKGLAPQGIQSAVIYGPVLYQTTPEWVEWITLPGKNEFDRGVSPLELATHGETEAIAFLIRRILNPDLSEQLATGGIFVQVLHRKHLLHIMCDAPLCPTQDKVVEPIERLLRPLNIPGVKGLRLYGRWLGQRSPRWQYKIDFVKQPQMVPDPTPQFAATDAYVTELVDPGIEPIVRDDLTPSELWSHWQKWRQRLTQGVRRLLLLSQFFVPTSDSLELMLRPVPSSAQLKTAMVWGSVGVLTLVQVDLGLHYLSSTLNHHAHLAQSSRSPSISTPLDTLDALDSLDEGMTPVTPLDSSPTLLAQAARTSLNDTIKFHQSVDQYTTTEDIFDSGSFTADPADPPMMQSPDQEASAFKSFNTAQASLPNQSSLKNSPYPSFNSEQLDFKLALYYQRLLDVGPPEILIIGSSRALRGVNPMILEQSLKSLGYGDADVFNFGINGATAQVVELILQRILLPEQLPKLIVWADGARAFNSGRDDRTYNGILASEGYGQLLDGSFVFPVAESSNPPAAHSQGANPSPLGVTRLARSLSKSYESLDEQFSDMLAHLSASHDQRDRIKAMIQHGFKVVLPHPPPPLSSSTIVTTTAPLELSHSKFDPELGELDKRFSELDGMIRDSSTSLRATDSIDVDGFLPLQVRFDPTQYYQRYARVSGNYDKDYSNFRLQGTQDNALSTLLSLGQTYDIPIVFINMPLTQEYLDPFRTAHEQVFRQYMLNLALQQEHFIFRDLGELWLAQTEHRSYFSDPSHLNQYGAYEVSLQIAKDPMIPWDATMR